MPSLKSKEEMDHNELYSGFNDNSNSSPSIPKTTLKACELFDKMP